MTGRKKILVAALLALPIVWWLFFAYHEREFKGDAHIYDNGPLSSPRYRIIMREIPLFEPGEYRFTLRDPPNEKMTLMLYLHVIEKGPDQELQYTRTLIEADLSDSAGNKACSASGTPGTGRWSLANAFNDRQVLMHATSRDVQVFIHAACRDVPVRRHRSYTLVIRVKDVDANAPKVLATPTLESERIVLP